MRILGLDLGTKTLGVSVCDNTETIASFIGTIRFTENKPEESFGKLEELVGEYNIKKFVLGLPKNMNNTYGEATKRSLDFKEMLLKRFSIEVELQDERLTSVTANKILLEADTSRKKRKKKVDGIAATIILQNYLDIRKGQRR